MTVLMLLVKYILLTFHSQKGLISNLKTGPGHLYEFNKICVWNSLIFFYPSSLIS